MMKIKMFENFSKKEPYIYDNPGLVDMIDKLITKDGSSFICSYVASAVKMLEGVDIKIYGFSISENTDSEYFSDEEGDEGHHFAVLNDRYIIDPWIFDNYYNYPKTFNRSVFDLQNKNDEDIIRYIYGDKDNWTDITKHSDDFKTLFPNVYKDLIDYYNKL